MKSIKAFDKNQVIAQLKDYEKYKKDVEFFLAKLKSNDQDIMINPV